MNCSQCGNHFDKSPYYNVCKECRNRYKREWRRKRSPEQKQEYYNRDKKTEKKRRETNLVFYRTWDSILDHRKRGHVIEITRQELEMLLSATPIKCPFCSEPFGNQIWNKRTIDRIDNANILNTTTIRIICHRCNTMKGNLTDSEFIELCRKIGAGSPGDNT